MARWRKRGNRRVPLGLEAAGSALLLLACNSRSLDVSETDVVATFEDEDRDYSNLRTYILPDSVVDLCDVAMGGSSGMAGRGNVDLDCEEADHSLDKTILEELRKNLDELGYEEIDDPEEETPDVAFFVGIIARDNWFTAVSPGYCYDYYYWYWGCWYPGYSYTYNLPTSAIVIDMAVVDESEDGDIVSAWTAFLQGLHQRDADKSGKERVQEAMAQAFEQSPYLAEGGNQ